MANNDFSCIKQVIETVQLTMPLKYSSNEIVGVTEILDGWKRQFVPKLQGVVVNYRDIRLTRRPFLIHISRTAPRYDVTATFDMFCPSVGDIVKGKINRSSREHIGCLIEGTINATIHLPRNSSLKLSKFIRVNRDILFQINRFDFNRHTIRVNGHITPECIKLMEEHFPDIEDDVPEMKTNGLSNSLLSSHDGFSSSTSSSDESTEKSDSIAKNPTTNSSSNSDTSSDEAESSSNTTVATLKKSNKAAMHAYIKKEISETESSLCGSQSTSSPKLKQSKKRKRESGSSSFNSPETLKKKKKPKLEKETSIFDASEPKDTKLQKKKKHKEKSTLDSDLSSNVSSAADFEHKFSVSDPHNAFDMLQSIKQEVLSPTKSVAKKGKKRKHELSISDVNENSKGTKKKSKDRKHSNDKKKSKDRKHSNDKKKSKDRKKSNDKKKSKDGKKSKSKSKLVTAGDILKKDEKKAKSKKKKKDKGDKYENSIGVLDSIKSELN